MALGPINWDDVPLQSLKLFAEGILADAQTVVESIPAPESVPIAAAAAAAGRGRSKTDPAAQPVGVPQQAAWPPQNLGADSLVIADQLRQEWRQVKPNVKENPLKINVYKLPSKDGKGAWFSRRSIHEGLDFDAWKAGLEKEFSETMKVQSEPGSGGIRGISADNRVEDRPVEDVGNLSVFQLSARFPGPTAPRDFVTLLLTSETSHQCAGRSKPLRQYIIVSKPCIHPECPNRQGIIRGQYESVELIREVPIGPDSQTGKASPSHTDSNANERRRSATEHCQELPTAIEWLMVTRSDPGGSVPRFMVEKGTPPGIVNDAGKFSDWIHSRTPDGSNSEDGPSADCGPGNESMSDLKQSLSRESRNGGDQQEVADGDEQLASTSGIYGIITGIYGVASSVVASGFRQFGSPAASNASQENLSGTEEPEDDEPAEDDDDQTASSEVSSIGTFASALEKSLTEDQRQSQNQAGASADGSGPQGASRPLEKELRKLQEKRRKLDEKAAQMHDFLESKRRGSKEKDDAMVAKMRDKHEKELAKQEAKYKREMQKLEEKREQEERKAEARRRKTSEKEERLALTLELERARLERDVALKQVEILKSQVGELQAQNTMLVAQMGRMIGVGAVDSADSKASSGGGAGSTKSG
ncbi:hypothetical protein ESCO_000711 [Escovopsis weberi]|uniref:DUF3074 domain-containing protein n=1 Tax=Escovopsis weberi TaxID=150374 RepID=A0A0M8MX17_ESCWE|nr:hypothetical protein ESCO_000711 [Escovopsis weberi]